MYVSVGVCEGVGYGHPRVSRAGAEDRRAECVCEAKSELESVLQTELRNLSEKGI